MSTVTDINMIKAMWDTGSTGILHRFMKTNEIKNKSIALNKYRFEKITDTNHYPIIISIGVKEEDIKTLSMIEKIFDTCKIDAIMIDLAHADSSYVYDMIKTIRNIFGHNLDIIVGNIATREAAKRMCDSDIDAVRIGIGGGSCCSTRVTTGFGISTLQSIIDCNDVCQKYEMPIIADGGIKTSGDIAKLLAFGADCCTVGTLLAGTSESPFDVIEMDGVKYKKVFGMASKEAQELYKDGLKPGTAPEGISRYIKYTGDTKQVIAELTGGIRSAFTYAGARNLKEFKQNAEYTILSNGGMLESKYLKNSI